MYMKRMLEIGQAANGYVIECRVPIKPEKKEERDEMEKEHPCCCAAPYESSCEKQYIAKDVEEVGAIIKKLMPMLDASFTSEDEFNSAFDKAAK